MPGAAFRAHFSGWRPALTRIVLATRIATAAVLVPLVVAGIIGLPSWCVALIFAAVMAVGAWEWARLLGWATPVARGVYTVLYAVLAAVFGWLGHAAADLGTAPGWLIGAACLWWLIVVYWLLRFPAAWDASIGRPRVGATVGLVALCAAVVAVPAIHSAPGGAGLLLVFFVLIWSADTGAYFAGRALGRHQLAPAISPGKTCEGAIGGIVAALIVAAAGASLLGYGGARFAAFVLLGIWVAVVSIIGDLALSMFKRHAGLKDSGTLFPGHGGVLDRLDSVLAAVPWFALGLAWLPRG